MPTIRDIGEASGIALPFEPDGSGGVRLSAGDALIMQYVKVYAADCESDNPFQDLGIGLHAVFENSSESAWKSLARRRVEQMFKLYLERTNLARLKGVSFSKTAEGEDTMDVVFISIESNEELAVSISQAREGA